MAGSLQFGIAFRTPFLGVDVRGALLSSRLRRLGGDRRQGLGPRLGDAEQDLVLMRRKAPHRLDEAGNEVLAVFEMHVDVGEGRAAALVERDEPIIGGKGQVTRHDDDHRRP